MHFIEWSIIFRIGKILSNAKSARDAPQWMSQESEKGEKKGNELRI